MYCNTIGWLSLLAKPVVTVNSILSASLCLCGVIVPFHARDYFLLTQELDCLSQVLAVVV